MGGNGRGALEARPQKPRGCQHSCNAISRELLPTLRQAVLPRNLLHPPCVWGRGDLLPLPIRCTAALGAQCRKLPRNLSARSKCCQLRGCLAHGPKGSRSTKAGSQHSQPEVARRGASPALWPLLSCPGSWGQAQQLCTTSCGMQGEHLLTRSLGGGTRTPPGDVDAPRWQRAPCSKRIEGRCPRCLGHKPWLPRTSGHEKAREAWPSARGSDPQGRVLLQGSWRNATVACS